MDFFKQLTAVIAAMVIIVLAFAAGRYSSSQVVDESSEATISAEQVTDTHVQTITTTTQNPNGSVTVVQTQDSISKVNLQEDIKKVSEEVKAPSSKKLKIDALISIDTRNRKAGFSYGLAVSKEVLGPISVGIFGLNSGIVGLSAGISF